MKFLSDILARAGLTVDGVVTFNNTATGQTPATGDNSTKLATTAFIKNQSYLIANQTITVSGDATGSGTTSIALTLANSGVTAGTYGNASNIPTIVVDAKGRITSISTNAVSIITTLAGLSDVTLTSPSANQVLQYDGTRWVNGAAPTSYTLPIASASVLGGIKVGAGLSINSSTGVLSASGAGISSRDVCTFTATAGQTTFSCSYTVDQVDVFYNGSKLGASDFTATNGTTVVLNTACKVGDYLEIVSWVAGAGLSSSRTITINGVTYDLTANRSWSALPVGGTTGQILTKNSGTDYDAAWMDNYADWTSVVKHRVKAGESITKGQAVYVSSADGTNMIVSKASNASEGTSSKTMGLLESTVSNNGIANVVTEGLLAGLNTASANAGDPVWLGTNGNLIYGLLNKPSAPAHLVFIGVVTRSNANNGEIFVKVQNGFEMKELHDYVESGVQNNFVISYESSTDLYKPKSIATLLGYTAADDSLVVKLAGSQTITGVKTFSPSVTAESAIARGTNLTPTLTAAANSDVLVGLDIAPTFTNGAFTNVSNIVLRLTNTAGSIGLSPVSYSNVGSSNELSLNFGNTNLSAAAQLSSNRLRTGAAFNNRVILTTPNVAASNAAYLFGIDGFQYNVGMLYDRDNGWLSLLNGTGTNNTTYTSRLYVHSTGNVTINTATDAGFRLDVNGTARVQGNTTITGTLTTTSNATTNQIGTITNAGDVSTTNFGWRNSGNFVRVQSSFGNFLFNSTLSNSGVSGQAGNSDSGWYFGTAGADSKRVLITNSNATGGTIYIANNGANVLNISTSNNVLINTTSDAGFRLDVNGTARVQGALTVSTGYITTVGGNGGGLATTSNGTALHIWTRTNAASGNGIMLGAQWNSTGGSNITYNHIVTGFLLNYASGTNVINHFLIAPEINTTGGTNTSRGIYYNPTLTSLTGTTHIAFQNTTGDNLFGTTSGSVGIGANTSINASAILDITSTTKGVLFPRMTTTQRTAIASPAEGLIVVQTDGTQGLYMYINATWRTLAMV